MRMRCSVAAGIEDNLCRAAAGKLVVAREESISKPMLVPIGELAVAIGSAADDAFRLSLDSHFGHPPPQAHE